MGCDIHTIVEIKENDKWVGIDDLPEEFDDRNYSLFAFLAGVRNSFNTKGFEAKGLPEDISEKTKKELVEHWESDLHSESYLTLKELKDADKSDYSSMKCRLVGEFYQKFKELGGIIPNGMEIEEFEPDSIIDAIRHSFCPEVIAKWQISEEHAKELKLFKGIENLEKIAEKYNIQNFEDIRIVFGFDN